MSILLPYVLEKYGKSAERKLAELADVIGLKGKDNEEKARAFIEAIKTMERDMKIPEKIQGIRKEDIPELSAYAAKEANPLYPVPMLMNANELEEFYYDVLDEKAKIATTA